MKLKCGDKIIGTVIETGNKWLYPDQGFPFEVKYIKFKRNESDDVQEWEVGSFQIDFQNKLIIIGVE